jgi:hypothetical protein
MRSEAVILIYNGLLFILVTALLLLLWRTAPPRRSSLFVLCGMVVLAASAVGAFVSPFERFGKLQLLAWLLFVHLPAFLLGVTYLLFSPSRTLALACLGLAIGVLGIGVDAFLIEPHWLAVDHVTIRTPGLDARIRVAVIADIQTDSPGPYERRVFRRVRAEDPDMILMAGDYVHLADRAQHAEAVEVLNQILREAKLDAPLGIYAVRGNVDRIGEWQGIFSGLSATTFERSRTTEAGPVAVTGLSLWDSDNTSLAIEPQDGPHIVLGHAPDYSLGQVEADVLVAGHTHGGQVRLPFLGPLLTLSAVPRDWASGVTEISPGKTLVVSRGIGMERALAPRMRFLCRPQLVILDLVADESPPPSRGQADN